MTDETRSARKRSPLARRRVRILLVAVLLVAALFTTARVLGTLRDASTSREHWRLHDEALVLFEAGRFDEAAERYRAIVAERPEDDVAEFNLGLSLLESNDAETQAAGWRHVEVVAARDPDFDAAHTKLADRALSEGRDSDAIRHLTRVVAAPPEPAGARAMLAELLVRRGRQGEAIAHFREVVADDRSPPAIRARAALELARQHGRRAEFHRAPASEKTREESAYKQALSIIDSALASERTEGRGELLAMRPFALVALDRRPEALGAIVTGLEQISDAGHRASLIVLRAQIYWMGGDDARARSELDAALAADTAPSADVFVAVADLYESRGFRERAIDVLRTGLTTYPDARRVRVSLARSLFLAGRPAEADVVLGAQDELMVDDDLMVLRGDLRRAQGDLDGARSAYETVLARAPTRADVALRLHAAAAEMSLASPDAGSDAVRDLERIARELLAAEPESAEARLGIARALLVRRDGDAAGVSEARVLLKEALELEPLLFEAQIALAVADLRSGYSADAVLGLERVIAALPTERPRLRLLLAEGCLAMGAASRGFEESQRAVDGLGDDSAALRMLVRAAQTAGRRDIALETLRRLAMLEPNEVAHPIAQAFLFADRGEMGAADRAIAAAQAIAEALPEGEDRSAALRAVAGGKAAALARAGDIDGAKGAFRALVGRLPRDVEARVRYGRFLQATGDVVEAERVYQEAVRIDDIALLPRRALVELWTDQGELTEELTAMVRRMRVVGGDDPVVLYAEGRLAALQGDLQMATERLTAAAEGRPDDGDVHFALGVVHSRAGNLAAAVASHDRTVALLPGSTRARDALSRARFAHAQELTRTGRLRAARKLLEDAVRDDPTAAPTRAALADALRYTGDAELSESQVRAMTERDPDDMLARRMLACALAARGAMTEAAEELAVVASAEPDDWTAWAALSAAYLEAGAVDEAEAAARRSREVAPTLPGSIAPTVELLVRTDRAAEAGTALDAEIARFPEEPIYRLMRAMLHSRAGEHRRTIEQASAALDLAPEMSRAAHLAVTAMRFGLGDSDGALAFAKARAAKAPDAPDMAYLVGWLEARRGNPTGALAALAPLVEREPPHQDALASSILILLEQRETADARGLIDAGLAVNPENPSFHFMRAQAVLLDALAMGDTTIEGPARTVVVRSLERTLELAPQHHTARNNLAFVLASDRETLGEALEHSEQAVRQAPGHAPYADTLGTIQLKLDRVHAAITTFERALDVIEDARAQLKADEDAAVVKSEPDRLRRLVQRLDRQEAELRQHYDEALRRRGD